MYSVYNKSSADMSEVKDGSVDLIFTSPPYNISTPYGKKPESDIQDFEAYRDLLKEVFSECVRILKPNGKLIIEAADTVVTQGKYTQLAAFLQSFCMDIGLRLEDRYVNFVRSENGKELPEHHWADDYVAKKDTHSNSHQIIILSKASNTKFKGEGKILYINTPSTEDHPCPTPPEMRDFILDNYFKPGMAFVDPFMGTASVGKEVVRKGGTFIGYEVNKTIFEKTKQELDKIQK